MRPVISVVTADTWDDPSDLWNGLGIQLMWMRCHGDFILVRVVPCRPLHQAGNLPRIPASSAAHPRSHLLCKARSPASICHTHLLIRSLSDSLRRPVAIFKPAVFFFVPPPFLVPEEAHIILTQPPLLSLSDLKVCLPARRAYSSSL